MFASSAYRAPTQPGSAVVAGGDRATGARGRPEDPPLLPAKRKRQPHEAENLHDKDHLFISSLKLRFVKHLRLGDFEGISSAYLLRSGDLLLHHRDGLSILHEASEAPEPVPQLLTRKAYPHMEISSASCGMNTLGDGWRELVLAGGDTLLSAALDRDGHGAVTARDLDTTSMQQDDITCVFHGGDSYILGTASGAVYVLSRDDADSVPGPRTRLSKQQSLLSAVVGTGAQFLGGLFFGSGPTAAPSSSSVSEQAVVAVCPLPVGSRDLLLVATRSRLAVWADFTAPTKASEIFDIMLREILAHDLARQYNLILEDDERTGGLGHTANPSSYHTSDVHVEALGMVLLPRNVRNGSANSDHCSIALLCSSYCYAAPECSALWVYVLELPLGVDGGDAALKHEPFIANRFSIAKNLLSSILGDPSFRPSVHYVKFIEHPSTLPVAVTWAGADGLLRISLCEIAVLALSTAAHEAIPLPLCRAPGVQSIGVSDVLSVAPARGLLVEEGLFVILKDGSMYCTHASGDDGDVFGWREDAADEEAVPGTASASLLLRSSPLEVDAARGTQLMLRAAKEFAFIEDFGSPQKRWARAGPGASASSSTRAGVGVAPMSSACRAALADLRQYLESTSNAAILEAVRRSSSSICMKLPVGQSWGESTEASAGAAGGGAAYTLITTMLREKRAMHEKLVRVLQNTRTWGSVPGVRRSLRVDHGLLLTASGLCGALLECEAKHHHPEHVGDTAAKERGGVQWDSDFLASGHAALLGVCRAGISGFAARWLEQQQALPEADLAAMGLRPVDVFFAATLQVPHGMLIIAQELQTQSERLERDQLSLPCAFALGSMLLAALEGTASSDTSSAGSGDGGEELIAADVSGFKDVREALKISLEVMLRNLTASASTHSRPQRLVTRSVPATTEAAGQAAWSIRSTASDAGSAYAAVSTSDFVPAASWSTAEAYVASVGWRREVEGNRLVHMCSVLLKGFETAARNDASAAVDFEDAKAVCVGTLLAVGQVRDAFSLACTFTYLPGLVASADRDPAALLPALAEQVRLRSETRGLADGSSSLGLFVLCDLETRGYFSRALEFAEYVAPSILKEFLETRPMFASIYMRQGDGLGSPASLATSSAASLQAAQREAGAASAAALLSLGKLCAALALRDAAIGESSGNALASETAAAAVEEVWETSTQVFGNTATGLAIIRAQDIAIQCGAMTASVDERGAVIRSSGNTVLTALLSHARGLLDAAWGDGFGAAGAESLHSSSSEAADLVECLGAALAVLSELERDVRRREQTEASGTVSMRATVTETLVDLWAAAMEADAPLWVRLSESVSRGALIEGPEAEADLRGTVLAQLCVAVAGDVASDVAGRSLSSDALTLLCPIPGSPLLRRAVVTLHDHLRDRDPRGHTDVNILYNLAEACVGYIFRS